MKKFNRIFLLVFFSTTFSGVFRKWTAVTPSISHLLFLIQLLAPFTFLLAVKKTVVGREFPLLRPLLYAYAACLIPFSLNPLHTSLYHGIAGIMIHSVFWIILIGYFSNHHTVNLFKYNYLFIAICILESGIATLQYYSPENLQLNHYAAAGDTQEQLIAWVGDAPRSSGTFSYLSGFSAFCSFMAFLSCYCLKKDAGVPLSLFTICLGSYNCLLSGSRGTLIVYFLTLFVFVLSELPLVLKGWFICSSILLFYLLATYILSTRMHGAFPGPVVNLSSRFSQNPEELASRVLDDLTDPFTKNFSFSYSGIGLGSTYQGANEVFGRSPILTTIAYEGELYRLVIEGGYLLLIFRFVLLGCFFSYLRIPTLLKIYLFLVTGLFLSIVFNIYSSIYTALGLILLHSAYPTTKPDEA